MIIKYTHGFKIRTKNDAQYFLEECIYGNSYSTILVNNNHCFTIYRNQKTERVWITEKFGTLCDIFNPEIQIPDEEMVDYIWKMRKYINKKWFNN